MKSCYKAEQWLFICFDKNNKLEEYYTKLLYSKCRKQILLKVRRNCRYIPLKFNISI